MKFENPLKIIYRGYLADHGWLPSFFKKMPINSKGEPIPWLMYSFIDYFLNLPKIVTRFKKLSFFEYGSGNSTLFFSKYFKEVTSVEHNKKWIEQIAKKLPKNARIIYKHLVDGGHYSKAVKEGGKRYDLILVDGRDRGNSLLEAKDCLTENGVLILDNSERPQYEEARKHLKGIGFKELQFWGIPPGSNIKGCTSIFYREDNIFDI